MSTPIESNTEGLQEILQTIYNLPMAGGGGSAEPDLIIPITGFSFDDFEESDIGEFDSSEVNATLAKVENGENVNVLIKGLSQVDSGSPVVTCIHPTAVYARDGSQLFIEFIVPRTANGVRMFARVQFMDGALYNVDAAKITTDIV